MAVRICPPEPCPCSSVGEHLVHTQGVGGSTPSAGTGREAVMVAVAQRLERPVVAREVAGSNPASHPKGARHRW
jgi:hypothetical protein